MRVTQADIAREVGVSQPAVSVILRGGGDQAGIPTETQRRVLDVARRLGYAPNPVAQNLQGSRTRLLGVHSFEAVFPIDRRDYYYEFLLGIEEQAETEGYDLVLFTSTAGAGDRRRRLFRDGVNRLRIADGSVLLGRTPDRSDLVRLAGEGYPFVHVGRRDVPGASIPYVTCDYAAATEAAVGTLAEHGHRTFAYVGIRAPFEPQTDRRVGFRRGVRAVTGTPDERVGLEELDAPELTAEWLTGLVGRGVTALLVESNEHASVLRDVLAATELSVPRDLSVVVLDQGTEANAVDPAWSTVTIPRADMGRESVRVLLGRLDDPPAPLEPVVLPCLPAGTDSIAAPRAHQT